MPEYIAAQPTAAYIAEPLCVGASQLVSELLPSEPVHTTEMHTMELLHTTEPTERRHTTETMHTTEPAAFE